MNAIPVDRPTRRRVGVLPLSLLSLSAGSLGYLAALPLDIGLLIVAVGVGLGAALRARGAGRGAELAAVPVLAALILVAVASPFGLLPELAAGVAGVAFLLWLADDPDRPAGGPRRSRTTIAVPGLALGIAWASALLLPSRSASLGVAAGLLVVALGAVAYLVGRPDLFDREEAATS